MCGFFSKGDMHIYTNQGLKSVENDGPNFWGPNNIFDPASEAIGRDLNRLDLHLIDWDGDGACDIVWTDPDNQNRPQLWRNRIKETGNFDWEWHSNPARIFIARRSMDWGSLITPCNLQTSPVMAEETTSAWRKMDAHGASSIAKMTAGCILTSSSSPKAKTARIFTGQTSMAMGKPT
ncbi:hypothetical protein BDV59DRAFT_85085 [Aspergillus ambiguus]|uniref:uncharacterized protein n=1 Tax=Aspergillus ambiguus TaxID=176160 RepID=UPI003CCDB14E